MGKKETRKKLRVFCKLVKHNWKPVNKSKLGFRIKDICIRCGKIKNVYNKEFYIE